MPSCSQDLCRCCRRLFGLSRIPQFPASLLHPRSPVRGGLSGHHWLLSPRGSVMAAPNLALSSGLAHSCKNAPIQQAQSQRAISPIVHLVAPSSRPDNGDDEAEMRPPTNPRTFGALTTERERMRTQIQRSFDLHVTDPVKIAARKVSASPDTVESHRANVPKSWAQMIAYCRAYPAFGLEILDLMGIDIDRDRTAYAVFLALKQQMRGA